MVVVFMPAVAIARAGTRLAVVLHWWIRIEVVADRNHSRHGGIGVSATELYGRLHSELIWLWYVDEMNAMELHIALDIQMSDGLRWHTMVEVAEFMLIHFDQEVIVVVDNAHTEGVAEVETVMMALLLLPTPRLKTIHHHCMLASGVKSKVNMQWDVLMSAARTQFYSE